MAESFGQEGWVKWLAFGCVHAPFHDPDGVEWILEHIREKQPDYIVNLGDFLDMECLSRFEKEGRATLRDEYEVANGIAERINDAAPEAKKVWLAGNHEQRFQRTEFAHLRDVIDYRKHMPATRAWKHIDYRQDSAHVFTLGQVTFMHGFALGILSRKDEAYQYSVDNGLTVQAHDHKPHPVHRISFGARKVRAYHAAVGTHISEEYVKSPGGYMQSGKTRGWGQGLVYGACDTKRKYDGRPRWVARTIVRQMFDGEPVEPAMQEEMGVAA